MAKKRGTKRKRQGYGNYKMKKYKKGQISKLWNAVNNNTKSTELKRSLFFLDNVQYLRIGTFVDLIRLPLNSEVLNGRLGRDVYVKSIFLNIQANMAGAVDTYKLWFALVRVNDNTFMTDLTTTQLNDLKKEIWRYKEGETDFFWNWLKPRNFDYLDKYNIVWTYMLNFSDNLRTRFVKKKFNINKRVRFTNLDTDGKFATGKYWLFIQSDSDTPGGTYMQWNVRYKDG